MKSLALVTAFFVLTSFSFSKVENLSKKQILNPNALTLVNNTSSTTIYSMTITYSNSWGQTGTTVYSVNLAPKSSVYLTIGIWGDFIINFSLSKAISGTIKAFYRTDDPVFACQQFYQTNSPTMFAYFFGRNTLVLYDQVNPC